MNLIQTQPLWCLNRQYIDFCRSVYGCWYILFPFLFAKQFIVLHGTEKKASYTVVVEVGDLVVCNRLSG